jgi:flagellar biogenesis protein FliO
VIDTGEIVRFLAAFAVIGCALLGFAVVARGGGRMSALMRRNRGRIIDVIETTPLPHAGSLHVIKAGESYFVIGRTDHAIALLREIPKEAIDRVSSEAPLPATRFFPSRLR